MKRTIRVDVALTSLEHAEIVAAAATDGRSIAEILRTEGLRAVRGQKAAT